MKLNTREREREREKKWIRQGPQGIASVSPKEFMNILNRNRYFYADWELCEVPAFKDPNEAFAKAVRENNELAKRIQEGWNL